VKSAKRRLTGRRWSWLNRAGTDTGNIDNAMLPFDTRGCGGRARHSHIAVKLQSNPSCQFSSVKGKEIRPFGCPGIVDRQVEATEMPDCARNGLSRGGGIGRLGGDAESGDIRRPLHKSVGHD